MRRHITIMALFLATTFPARAAEPVAVPEADPPVMGGMPEPVYVGPLADVGRYLHDNGIDVRLDYLNIYQNAPTFGFKTATYGVYVFDATGNLTPDLRVRYSETFNLPSYNVAGYSNSFIPPVFDKSNTDLTRLTLEADFFDHRLQVEAGRMGLAQDFLVRGFCGGIGCFNAIEGPSLNLPDNAMAVWGGRVAYKPTPITTLGFGIIEDNPDNWQNGNGWDWGVGKAEGYIAVANIRHDETFLDSANPLKFEVGAYYRSTPYVDALYNSGWGNPTFGANTKIITHDSGNPAVYAHARKVVWSDPTAGMAPENLAVYGGVYHNFGEGQAYPWEAYAGLEYSGFWSENPLATVGVGVHYIRLSKERSQYEQNARLFFSGVDQQQPQDMFMIDSHASTSVFGNGIFDVGAAYIINPNTNILADLSTGRQKDGFVFYAALAFDLGGSLGLSPRRGP